MRFYSYAQEYEDLILFIVLRNVDKVFYIDVGANDPTYLSVTKAFYERGGCGINIEPLRDKCRLLAEERTRDINLCMGIGAAEGELDLVCDGTGSTFSIETIEERNLGQKSTHKKKIMTLTQIWEQYCKPYQQIHFCKIDVEGFEKDVLQGCNYSVFRPWIFVVEAMKPGTSVPSYDEWEKILLNNGYILGYSKGINRYYVDVRREYLLDLFNDIDKFAAENEIVQMTTIKEKREL